MSGSVIQPWKVLSSNTGTPQTRRLLEKATQTFLQGTPVVVEAASGYLIASPTISSALTIAGFSQEAAANLTASGTAQTLSQGAPINQSNAVIIPGGAWPNDGRNGVWIADNQTIFIGTVKDDQTPAITDVGLIYGLTKDGTSNLWYVDKTITAAGSGAILEIVELPVIPGDSLAPSTPVAGGKVAFRVTRAGQQFAI